MENHGRFNGLTKYVDFLPSREQALIRGLIDKKSQKDIAIELGITQGAVSSKLKRALKRLTFLDNLRKIDVSTMDQDLKEHFGSIDIALMRSMSETTCQSETAKVLNEKFSLPDDQKMTQVKVRHHFWKCLTSLDSKRKVHPELQKYFDLVTLVSKNLYMLHELKGRYAKDPETKR